MLSVNAVDPVVDDTTQQPRRGTDRSNVDHVPADWEALDAEGLAFLNDALAAGEPSGHRAAPPGLADPDDGALVELLDAAVASGASDLHLGSGQPPHVRVDGHLRPLAGTTPFEPDDLDRMLAAVLTGAQRATLDTTGGVDAALGVRRGGRGRRFRAAVFRQSGSLAASIRIVEDRIRSLTELVLPPVVADLADAESGLVLVTGTTGSGKSTTLAAMIDRINRSRPAHIVTIEDPVEYRHVGHQAVIHQREVGADTESFATALRQALRQDPDVVLIGELRDLETIRIALTAAETGHVVFATLHSGDATSAVTRIVDVFPGDQQAHIRSQLALSLAGVVSQRLVPGADAGRVAVTEVLVGTAAVRNLIREGKDHQLRSAIETGGDDGMHTFAQAATELARRGRLGPAARRDGRPTSTELRP